MPLESTNFSYILKSLQTYAWGELDTPPLGKYTYTAIRGFSVTSLGSPVGFRSN